MCNITNPIFVQIQIYFKLTYYRISQTRKAKRRYKGSTLEQFLSFTDLLIFYSVFLLIQLIGFHLTFGLL
jgi:hypothetical protein